jgi:hypothetical protein
LLASLPTVLMFDLMPWEELDMLLLSRVLHNAGKCIITEFGEEAITTSAGGGLRNA